MKQHAYTAQYYRFIYERLKENPGNFYNITEAVYYLYKAEEKLDNKKSVKGPIEFLMSSFKDIPGKVKRKQRSKLSFLKRRY